MKKWVIQIEDGRFLKHAHTIDRGYHRRATIVDGAYTSDLEEARIFNNKSAASNARANGLHGAKAVEVVVTIAIP
jgi:hypothetical protein